MPDESVFDATQRALLDFLKSVNMQPPRDQADARTYLAIAFMCGAGAVASVAGVEHAKPFIAYADTLKQRYEGFSDMMNMGGVIIPS